MSNDFKRAERRWRKKSLFHREHSYGWLTSIGWIVLIGIILLVVMVLMKPPLVKQFIAWFAQ